MICNFNSRTALLGGLRATKEGHKAFSTYANCVLQHAKKQENMHDFGLWLLDRVARADGKG